MVTPLRYGANVLDALWQSRDDHEDVSNLVFWDQPTLRVYTPSPDFYAAHSLLVDASTGVFPVPDTSHSPFPTVKWQRTTGTVSARSVLPDGSPPVHELRILDDDPQGAILGTPWAFQTADLGPWAGGYKAKGRGDFEEDRAVAVTLRFGESDAPPSSVLTVLTDVAEIALGKTVSDTSSPGDVRVTAGNLWSVLFAAGSDPAFEQRYPYKDKAGAAHEWVRLHTFTGATPNFVRGGAAQWLVTFAIVAGHLAVSVGGHSAATEAYVYSKPDPRRPGEVQALHIPAGPVRVSGRAGGGPRWIGLRRISWGIGQFSETLGLGSVAPADLSMDLIGWRNVIGDEGLSITAARTAPTTLRYTAQVRGSIDGRTTAALKWVWLHSDRTFAPGSSGYVDYGGAVEPFTETMAEPDFSGGGGTRGSDGSVDLTLDMYELDMIATAAGTDWRADLAPYVPVTFVLGQVRCNADGSGEEELEIARLSGYFERNTDDVSGFHNGKVERGIRDQFLRLKDPGPLIDTSYSPLDLALTPAPDGQIYGYQAVQMILRQTIGDAAADNLRVYLPSDHYSLGFAKYTPGITGSLPASDLPVLLPPYGKYPAEWLKEIATLDFAALYPAGNVWVYGQFDQIVSGLPAHDIYDGRGVGGDLSGTGIPDTQLAWTASSIRRIFNTSVDYNRWVVWGDVPGGAGTDAPKNLGAPLLTADVRDFAGITASWERAKLFQGGQFYDKSQIQQFIRTVKSLSEGHKAAVHLELTFPFALPEVFWGHKFTLHGFPDIQDSGGSGVDGKTFRVYRMSHTGDMNEGKTTCKVTVIELLGGEM